MRAKGPITQLLAIYLTSCAHATFLCIYRLPIAYIVADLSLSEEQIRKSLAELEEIGFAKYDEENEIVFVVKGVQTQVALELKPRDTKVKAMRRELSAVPGACSFKQEFFDMYADAYHLVDKDADESKKPAPTPVLKATAAVEQKVEQAVKPLVATNEPDFADPESVIPWLVDRAERAELAVSSNEVASLRALSREYIELAGHEEFSKFMRENTNSYALPGRLLSRALLTLKSDLADI